MPRRLSIGQDLIRPLALLIVAGGLATAAEETPEVRDTQRETTALTSPEQAAASFELPEGFRISLFASEPDVRQPIGVTTDARGRLWVAENFTYSESKVNFDLSQRDRIVILEDADHDGRA